MARKTPARGRNGRFKKSARRKRTTRKRTARKRTARKKTARKKTARRSPARKRTARKKTARRKTARRRVARKKPAKRRRRRRSAESAVSAAAKKAFLVASGMALSAIAVRSIARTPNQALAVAGVGGAALLFMAKEIGAIVPFVSKKQVEMLAVGVMADGALKLGSKAITAPRSGTVAGSSSSMERRAPQSHAEFLDQVLAA